MAIPADLTAALERLPEDPRFELVEGWTERPGGVFSFKFRAGLSEPATVHMPEWSAWHLVIKGSVSDPSIEIYPDAEDGIVATFQHQDHNQHVAALGDWRTGKPCLERPAAVFQRKGWAGEPEDLAGRIIWLIGRLFVWIDAAAADRLLEEGDPLELPSYPAKDGSAVLGFRETAEDLNWWIEREEPWGFATILDVPGAGGTAMISDFMDPQRRNFRRMPWSPAIPLSPNRVDAIWMAIPALVVIEPWRAPSTWAELSRLCAEVSIDLPSILATAGGRLRRLQRPKEARPVHLLIGFPLAERVGEEPQRFHWIAVRNLRLCRRDDVRKGFRNLAEQRQKWDRGLAMSDQQLEWRKTANWAPDQLRKRGEAEDEVRSKAVLVIGAGSLGSAVAENLLRMGVTRLGLLDPETLQVGNLSRHLLTMADTSAFKAERMARRLNLAATDASVEPMVFSFPPTQAADIDRIKDWNVVVDCTASDAVLHAMADFPWATERLFVSLAMTWEAKGLFAFAASETGFPAIDCLDRFNAASPAPEETTVGAMEGIGCWHPVFPATADDVNLWAAIGSKFVRRAIIKGGREAALYLQQVDGSVERRDA